MPRGCGLSDPDDVSSCPHCATAASLPGELRPEFLPLRGLGNVLTVLLAGVVATIVGRLVIQLLSRGLWGTSRTAPAGPPEPAMQR